MSFKAKGVVTEVQSGLPIAGVLVVAYNKNVLCDDLLGTAETDPAGQFSISYRPASGSSGGFGPDLYVAVFAPPCRRLLDTACHIRTDAGSEEVFELKIDPEMLLQEDKADVDLDFSADLADAFEWEVG